MYQLSKRAELIIKLAKEAAREYGQSYVGTEHLLLAIVREGSGLGARILAECGATEERLTEEIARILKDRLNETWILGRLPGTRNFRDVLRSAAEAARGHGNWQIGSVHLLIALLNEPDCVGYQALRAVGVSSDTVRKAVIQESSAQAR